jgi:sugar phosphate isomerase/epimerase
MKISIAAYSFHGLRQQDMMDVFGYLETVKYRYRLDTADLWTGIIGHNPDNYLNEPFLKKLKAALEEREMSVANYHLDGATVWNPDPDVRERDHAMILRHLDAAETLGAKTVRVDFGGRSQEMGEEQFDHLVKRYREYARRAADHGYRIGPENHFGPSVVADPMERVAQAVDHPGYGILLHLGHWEVGDDLDGDRRLAPWTVHTHVDARVARTDLAERMRILLDAGYEGYWGVEHHSARNEYAEVAAQLAEVQRVWTRLKTESPTA